jgi:predicted small lipoprotein YifL
VDSASFPGLPGLSSRIRPLRRASLAMIVGTMLLAGCGQRGPLYLPEQAPAKRSAAPAPGPGLAATLPIRATPAPRS